MTARIPFRAAALAACLALAGCAGAEENASAEPDLALLAEGADPALTSALEDQILVDPALVQQAHPNAVRPPEAPVQAQYPPMPATDDSAGNAARAADRCNAALDRGPEWARRLPDGFPLYPGSRLTGAAGLDEEDCRVRIVGFRTADPHVRVLDHYRRLAGSAGFTAEHRQRGADHMLAGVEAGGERAFVLVVTPLEHGSEVALIVDGG